MMPAHPCKSFAIVAGVVPNDFAGSFCVYETLHEEMPPIHQGVLTAFIISKNKCRIFIHQYDIKVILSYHMKKDH